MEKLFHALYQSYLQENEFSFDCCDEETDKLLFTTFQEFFSALPHDKKATFRDWENLSKQLQEKEKEFTFIEGVKCGVRFILETTNK